jgi:hypothetical protein
MAEDLKHYTIGGDTSRTYQLDGTDATSKDAKANGVKLADGPARPDKDGNAPTPPKAASQPANKGGSAPANKGAGTGDD